jgi:hypothetical protein
MKRIIIASLGILVFTGCAQTGTLYPSNKQAESIGQLTLKYGGGEDSGRVQVVMPDGEILTVQYRVVNNTIYGSGTSTGSFSGNLSSFGATGSTNENFHGYSDSNSSIAVTPGSSNGMCVMTGEKGTNASCNFFVNKHGLLKSGAGTCKFSNGAEYNLMF